jgi:serine/threonine protein kinase
VSNEVRDLISKLLVEDPSKRLGANGDFAALKSHDFFKGINFETLPSSDFSLKSGQKRNTATFSMPTDFVFAFQSLDEDEDEQLSHSDRKSESKYNIYRSVFLPSIRSNFIIYEGFLFLIFRSGEKEVSMAALQQKEINSL